MRWMTGWFAVVLAAAPLTAQERGVSELDLPRGVADDVIAFFNDSTTIRFQGRAQVPAGSSIQGNVAVLGGPLQVAGDILGEVVVVNGNLILLDGAGISGNVTVLGGEVLGPPEVVAGQLTVFGEPLTYRRQGERIEYDERPWSQWNERRRLGNSYFSLRAGANYNRIEGLPVMFGPVFRTRVENYFRAEALGIWRSESGLRISPDELGYYLRAEQHFGPRGRFALGGTAHSMVEPIEDAGLLDIEASLATFLLHRDFRDYYDREGYSAYLRYDNRDSGLRAGIEYRDEDHGFAAVGSPWTIRRNDGPWRPQPLVGEGRLRSVSGRLVVDHRNDPDDPSDGWYVAARATAGVGGDLTLPEYFQPAPGAATVVEESRRLVTDFRVGSLDVRRYTRLGPNADLRVRGFLAGSLDGEPVPAQYQRTLGGEGSLPGFALMTVDCGARAEAYSVFRSVDDVNVRTPTFAGYGCDRVALFQAEYRGSFAFNLDLDSDEAQVDDWHWYPAIDLKPSWSVFFDAGRGWSLSEAGTPGYLGPDSETMMDVGIGFFLGDVGVYWAWPLNGADRDVNFFVRVDHRF
ncbi:MAG TPA: hypothetical protein VLA36_06215 [Longimicrobiales bacterium]|nr:hypothetical protein [Longimicrobiales bacterium]